MREQRKIEISVAFMLLRFSLRLSNEVYFAVSQLGTAHAVYGAASLVLLPVCFAAQVFLIKVAGKAPWLSKDVAMTACGLGAILQAYRDVYGDPKRPGALTAEQLQTMLFLIEAVFMVLPMLVLKGHLLMGESADGWASPMLLVSFFVSLASAATLVLEAERLLNRWPSLRRICAPPPTNQTLPLHRKRRLFADRAHAARGRPRVPGLLPERRPPASRRARQPVALPRQPHRADGRLPRRRAVRVPAVAAVGCLGE